MKITEITIDHDEHGNIADITFWSNGEPFGTVEFKPHSQSWKRLTEIEHAIAILDSIDPRTKITVDLDI